VGYLCSRFQCLDLFSAFNISTEFNIVGLQYGGFRMRFMFWILFVACGSGPKGDGSQANNMEETDRSPVADDETGLTDPGDDPGGDSGIGSDTAMAFETASLDVTELELLTTPDATQSHRFKFILNYADGTSERVIEGVEWILNDAQVGTIDETGRFTTSTEQGGRVDVIARYEDHVAMAAIIVKYRGELIPEGFDVSVFDVPETSSGGTGMTYPPDGIVIPKNQPSMHFQWENMGASAYRLVFESDVTELTIYSTSLDWLSDEDLWPVIGESNAGSIILSTLSARVGDFVQVRDSQGMVVQDLEATGSVIYWTPTAQGLMEIPYGEPARSFLTVSETGHCIGCHSVSSAGMVAFVYNGSSAPLGMKSIDDLADVIPYGSAGNTNYKTFSPDGGLLLTNLNGVLSLYDGITGAFLGNPTIDGGGWVNNMDWAPDDSYLVFIDSVTASGDLNFSGGIIKRAEHLGGGVFGPAETIMSLADMDPSYGFNNLYYPAVSPDSKWVIFNASTGDSYDDPDATMFVVPIDGGTPIELGKANITASMGNSLPRWAPATAGDDVWWFAFASRRIYGSITGGNPQIWMSSFDPRKAAAGDDPSSVAIWLPNQDAAQNNHIPQWVD